MTPVAEAWCTKLRMAKGSQIWEKEFLGATHNEGLSRRVKAQVCDVSKPLMSVARLVGAGNTVVFAPEGSYIWDPSTGECMALEEKQGMYTLGLWAKVGSSSDQGF